MTTRQSVPWISLAAVALAALVTSQSAEKTHKLTSISPRKMADSLHAVIAADRSVYSQEVVQRLVHEEKRLPVAEDWREQKCLPVHAQLLRLAAVRIQQKGAEFSYTLRSLWPINPNQGPQTEIERLGLEAVARNPATNYYAEEELGGRSYFTAVYADRAALPSCVRCHNEHPASPKRDFRTNDVMGALIIRIPLEF